MLIDKSITDFVDDLASDSPMPGGGGVAALAGALGAGLGLMVCSLTEGKEKFKNEQESIVKLKQEGTRLKEELLRGVDGDGYSYIGIVNAYKLPKSNEAEIKIRNQTVQEATKEAARFSLSVGQNCLQVMKYAIDVVQFGNPNAASESLACGLLAYAGVYSALVTVEINLSSIKDYIFIKDILTINAHIKEQAEVLKEKISAEAAKRILIR
ncbi:cyclodeaminase/cyclohydrolase family protein [Sporomusa sp. KB1]|jgi:glutamate formiminotransferase/formiminotetrahydrofolate cyclodeaminase|uniref:cyclodeaminase/cyclohydrolase family protein n=1 Tax=Sporomusa sp. KB1 TaxID=943346 RepID=UPI00119F548F|nr:cyclodeaminase/cyclohydrolase family protein [Sporomusa sp. KB1]TWH51978.1 glutamate formiminotransferase/formiminotetrahydrofolate cyclodeaminase [Sporomusa sp. KB1]